MKWHPDDHRPDWRDDGAGTVYCAECGHHAQTFACTTCGKIADESVIGHGSLGTGTHYPVRPKGQE
ncbi:MAG: hypothetical protein GY906_10195 [bacterium]|nr:hypothetical protein [bacterium]